MPFRSYLVLAFSIVLLVVVTSGCARAPVLPPAPVVHVVPVTIVGTSDLNAGGNAAVVRIYQLQGDANFRRATVEAFWQSDEQVLGQELVPGRREILLYPGQSSTIEIELSSNTRYIGVAADLRSPETGGWRELRPVGEVVGRSLVVTVGTNNLGLSVQ
jgi:type VI secretion system VasD/TssJ family lipoprotein